MLIELFEWECRASWLQVREEWHLAGYAGAPPGHENMSFGAALVLLINWSPGDKGWPACLTYTIWYYSSTVLFPQA